MNIFRSIIDRTSTPINSITFIIVSKYTKDKDTHSAKIRIELFIDELNKR